MKNLEELLTFLLTVTSSRVGKELPKLPKPQLNFQIFLTITDICSKALINRPIAFLA